MLSHLSISDFLIRCLCVITAALVKAKLLGEKLKKFASFAFSSAKLKLLPLPLTKLGFLLHTKAISNHGDFGSICSTGSAQSDCLTDALAAAASTHTASFGKSSPEERGDRDFRYITEH